MPRGFDIPAASRFLRRVDPALGRWMRKIGPMQPDPRWRKPFDTVDALARSILYQQLSGKAAATIVARVETAIAAPVLHAEALARVADEQLRACGVSRNKLLALRDLCRHHQAGELPSCRQMARMPDQSVIEHLTAVRGVGRWTAEMLLIFRLGRPDILALDDLGLRNGAGRLDRLECSPTPRQLAERGSAWGPYRSLASLYLWRIADAEKGVDPGK